MAKSKTPVMDAVCNFLDIPDQPAKKKKPFKWTTKDTVETAAAIGYIYWFFHDWMPSRKKNTGVQIQYRTPFVLPDVKNNQLEPGKPTLKYTISTGNSAKLEQAATKAAKDAFRLAGFHPGETEVMIAPKYVRVTVGVNVLEAGRNVVNKVKPYLEYKFACDNLTVTKKDGYKIVIDWPHDNYLAVLGDFFLDPKFTQSSKTSVAIGCGANGNVFFDVAKMPHMLIAGTTGSGKSIFMHSLILSLLMKNTPDDIELYMIDPKMTEYSNYQVLPYCHVVQSAQDAVNLLATLVSEMKERYSFLRNANVRDIDEYNAKNPNAPMKRKVLFIDELAQLMSDKQYKKQAEAYICQIAQLARAAGIHLIIATQRPTVNVVTGLIKANIECRVALKVNSRTDSMVILDQIGAEKLVGHGDMLFLNGKDANPVRLQGGFVDTNGISNVIMDLYQNVLYDSRMGDKADRVKYGTAQPSNTQYAYTAQPQYAAYTSQPYQMQPTPRTKKRHPILMAMLILPAVLAYTAFMAGAYEALHEYLPTKSSVTFGHEISNQKEWTPDETPGTWSNADTYTETTNSNEGYTLTWTPPTYDDVDYGFEPDYSIKERPEPTSYFVSEEAERAYWEGRVWNEDYAEEESSEYVVTGPYTYSAEPLDGSIDEYTISDAYVQPRIRTRDTTFVSHIDELHFTDD